MSHPGTSREGLSIEEWIYFSMPSPTLNKYVFFSISFLPSPVLFIFLSFRSLMGRIAVSHKQKSPVLPLHRKCQCIFSPECPSLPQIKCIWMLRCLVSLSTLPQTFPLADPLSPPTCGSRSFLCTSILLPS